MMRCSLSGRKNTTALDEKKLNYIKTIIQSRVPRMSEIEFASLWILCRSSISKSSQGFAPSLNRNCISYLTSNNVDIDFKNVVMNVVLIVHTMKDRVIDYM